MFCRKQNWVDETVHLVGETVKPNMNQQFVLSWWLMVKFKERKIISKHLFGQRKRKDKKKV